MRPVHPLQNVVIETLRAEGDAVDARGSPLRNGDVIYVFGVRLDGDLCRRRKRGALAHCSEDRGHPWAAKSRRRPTPEVHGVESRAVDGTQPELSAECGAVVLDRRGPTHCDGKIAVGASPCTKRNVDVEVA